MESFEGLEVGDKLECINPEGWRHFKRGGVYTVTELWENPGIVGRAGASIDLDGMPVTCQYSNDFELYEGE